jgi:polyisoprenoid-binding protein YceI
MPACLMRLAITRTYTNQSRKNMKHLLPLAAALSLVLSPASAQQTAWKLDAVHSNVLFTVRHLVVSEVTGKFKDFDVSLKTSGNDFSDASIQAVVKTMSIDTENESRDKHLRSDDFFNAQQYPEMKFVSTSMKKISQKEYALTGDLSIRDVTKPVTFKVEFFGMIDAGQFGTRSGWKATATINRFDYNLKWDRTIEAGGLVVGEDVTIVLNLEFSKA